MAQQTGLESGDLLSLISSLTNSLGQVRDAIKDADAAIAALAGAPTSSSYVSVAAESALSAERVLTGTSNEIAVTDGGANTTVTLSIPSPFVLDSTAGSGTGAMRLDAAAFSATANQDIARLHIDNTNGITIPAGTTTLAAALAIDEPNLVSTDTITNSAAQYIGGAASEGTNNYALWVDAGDTRLDGNLNVQGTGPHAIGGATDATYRLLLDGTFTTDASGGAALRSQGTITGSSGGNVFGVDFSNALTAVGTAPIGAMLRIESATLTGTFTSASTLYIPTAVSGATNNYALWVDAGTSRFDGLIDLSNTTSVGIRGGTANTGFENNSGANWNLYVADGGMIGIRETANANMNIGLTINQGPNDDQILALKSSDVAHGITGLTETDTYGYIQKINAANGGAEILGITAGGIGLGLTGVETTADATKSTAAVGTFRMTAALKSGTSTTSIGANSNIVVFTDNGTARQILDADGDSHQDVGTAWTNFDDQPDEDIMEAMAVALARPGDPLREDFIQHFEEKRSLIESLPGKAIVHFNNDGHHFANMSRVTMLHHGTIRRIVKRQKALEQRLLALEGPHA